MKTQSSVLFTILLMVGGTGCGKQDRDPPPAAPPAAPTGAGQPDTPAEPALPDSDAVVAYMKATIEAIDAAGGDCVRLIEPVVALARDNTDLIAEMAATSETLAAKQWAADHLELLQEFHKRLVVVAGCARGNPALVDVLKRLSPTPRSRPQ